MTTMLLTVLTCLLLTGPAYANLIWDWTGDCNGIITVAPPRLGGSNGCAGQATFHAVTTDTYAPGSLSFDLPSLLEATYTDDNVTLDFPASVGWLLNGFGFQLPAALADALGEVVADAEVFKTTSTAWRFGAEGLRPGCHPSDDPTCGYGAAGFNGVWTRIAEPDAAPTFRLFAAVLDDPADPPAVPAPSTLVLLGAGLVYLALLAQRSRARQPRRA